MCVIWWNKKKKSDILRNIFSYDDDLWRKTKYSAMQMTFSMLLSSSSMMKKWNVYPFYFEGKKQQQHSNIDQMNWMFKT